MSIKAIFSTGMTIKCILGLAGGSVLATGALYTLYVSEDKTKAFNEVLKPLGLQLIKIYTGSLCLMVQARSVRALKELWRHYVNGALHKCLEPILLTEEAKKLSEGKELVLITVEIDEQEYKNALLDMYIVDIEGKCDF